MSKYRNKNSNDRKNFFIFTISDLSYKKADQNFYITVNLVMNLAARAKELFESSEVDE